MAPGIQLWPALTITSPSIILGTNSPTVTLTIANCPPAFYAAIPNQYLWLNGTASGLAGTRYGTGEFVQAVGGTCTPNMANGTIIVQQATPGVTSISAHDSGFTLTNDISAAFEDDAQGSDFDAVSLANGPYSTQPYAEFGFVFSNDNNQKETVTNFEPTTYPMRSDADFWMGAFVFSPGPFSINAGITAVYSSDLSAQCSTNGVSWYSGNDIRVTDTIIQGWGTFGSKLSKASSGFGYATYKSVYSEGGCPNAIDPALGTADMIDLDYQITRVGQDVPTNSPAQFLSISGKPNTVYYLVSKSSTSPSPPVFIGYAQVADPSVNNVTVKWFTGNSRGLTTSTWDLLRVTANQAQGDFYVNGPSGTGNYLVKSGLTPAGSCNVKGVCSFVDNVAPGNLHSYQVFNQAGFATYFPSIEFLGGGTILSNAQGASQPPTSGFPFYSGTATCVTSPAPTGFRVALFNENTSVAGGVECFTGIRGMNLIQPPLTDVGSSGLFPATLLGNGLAELSATKAMTGRLNFGGNTNYTSTDALSIFDSNADFTEQHGFATASDGNGVWGRRQIQAADIGIGTDGLVQQSPPCSNPCNNAQMHAGNAWNVYINSVPDNSSWKWQFGTATHTTTLPLTSTVLPGTAPFRVASTTPVANLTTVPNTYNHSGSQQFNVHIVGDSVTLSSGTAGVTLSGSAGFTFATTFVCAATDQTSTSAVRVINNSGTSITFDGSSSDVIGYLCVGY